MSAFALAYTLSSRHLLSAIQQRFHTLEVKWPVSGKPVFQPESAGSVNISRHLAMFDPDEVRAKGVSRNASKTKPAKFVVIFI